MAGIIFNAKDTMPTETLKPDIQRNIISAWRYEDIGFHQN
jgi:hypothetical protein